MIRRPPSLVPIDDSDVQELRDLLDRLRAEKEEQRRQQMLAHPTQPSQPEGLTLDSGFAPQPTSTQTTDNAVKGVFSETLRTGSREERLGLR